MHLSNSIEGAIRQANYSDTQSPLETGPFKEKHSEQGKGRILLSSPEMLLVIDRFSQETV